LGGALLSLLTGHVVAFMVLGAILGAAAGAVTEGWD
jgi:hypothetical protein